LSTLEKKACPDALIALASLNRMSSNHSRRSATGHFDLSLSGPENLKEKNYCDVVVIYFITTLWSDL
jgi:hypothetical protein